MKRVLIFVIALIVIAGGFYFASGRVAQRRAAELDFLAQTQAATFVRPHSPTLGGAAARVYIVEFTDPACETCAAYSQVLKDLMIRYPAKLKIVIRYAPFHPGADAAVRVLEAAKMQNRFWETLNLLYRYQGTWTQHHQVLADRIMPLLPEAGIDMERLAADMNDPRIAAVIAQDLADAATLGVRKTPGIFVNGRPLEPFGVEPLAALVASEVEKQYPE